MTNITPPDIKERKMIAEELQVNFLVEAGAGSGKTSSLVNRMINLIKTGKYCVGEIAAITFTRKAAAELKERFQDSLEKEFRQSQDPLVSRRLSQALLDLDQSYLGTIHSFCSRLLRERPVEAGLDPEFQELEEVENKALTQEAWQRHLVAVKLFKPHLLENINKIGISLDNLQRGFNTLVNYPDLSLIYTKVEKPDLRPALETLKSPLKKAEPFIPIPPHDNRYDDLQKRVLKALRQLKYFDMNNAVNIASLLATFARTSHNVTQKLWLDKPIAKELRDEFNALGRDVISSAMDRWREYCHYHVMEFLLPGIESYHQIKKKESKVNFQDLLIKTSTMLKNYPEVRDYFQKRYKCLLIDEFQDTDPIQSEVMFYLTGSDLKEKDWQKLIPRAGSIFVVGDPKQSIYRFRRADIDTYNLVKEIIVKNGGQVINLTANFRSIKAIGDYCNDVFENLLSEKENPYQALYRPIAAQRNNPEKTDFGVKVLEIDDDFEKKEEIVPEDARLIASYIRNALDRGLKINRNQEEKEKDLTETPEPGDFLIILKYKELMEIYARALEELNIPVIITGGSSLKNSLEIDELLKIAQAVVDPDNQVNLTAVLRGMFFGISDDELYRFKKGGGTFNILSPLPPGLEKEIRKTFTEAFAKLKSYYLYSRRYLPTVALEKIITDLGLLPFALTEPLGSSKGGLILQVLEHLRQAEAQGTTTFAGIVSFFETLKDAGLEDELNLAPQGQNAVRLMNLHKAKGLEAPVVFLAHPYKNVNFDPDLHVSRTGDNPGAYFAFTDDKLYSKGIIAQPVNWQEYKEEEEKYQNAEETRLLYVAATRAKDLLIISKSNKDKSMSKNPWKPLLELTESPWVIKPSQISPPQLKDEEEISIEDLRKARQAFSSWTPPLSLPSYESFTPSTSDKSLEGVEIKKARGGGAAWGSVIHRILEGIVKGEEDLNTLIDLTLTENNLSLERKDEVLTILKNIKKSSLWQRIENAEIKITEVPFAYKVDKGHTPQLISGVIDLVFKEGDEWVIVDYKTDRVEEEKSLKALTAKYTEQIKAYALAWEDIVGERVKAAEIYYLHVFGRSK